VATKSTAGTAAKDPSSIPYTPEWYARQAKAWAGRMNQPAPVVQTYTPPPPAPAPAPPKYTSKPAPAKKPAVGGGKTTGGTYADGYNKAVAEANANKSNDAPQIAALQAMLDTGFASARDTKLANIQLLLTQQDKLLLDDYEARSGQLAGSMADNDKSEHDATFANLANRARERGDILTQAASQGAGESDTLRAALAAVRNWSANQSDVNRSFFDTQRSVNTAITDLNSDTRTARANTWASALSDQEQVWANYYNQRADAFTQMGNIQASKSSDSYKEGSDAFAKAAAEAGTSWKSPGLPSTVQDWDPSLKPTTVMLNNAEAAASVTNLGAKKKPEGATLRSW